MGPKMKLAIEFESEFHHGSGFGHAGLVDRTVLRTGDGIAYLNGSAIKGRLRHACLQLLATDSEEGAIDGKRLSPCGYGDQRAVCRGKECCALCYLFGSPLRRGHLEFGDGWPNESTAATFRDLWTLTSGRIQRMDGAVRHRTAIDRQRRIARDGLLYSLEVLPAQLRFVSVIDGDPGPYQGLIRRTCRLVTHFGADASRGLGRCSVSIVQETAE